MDNNTFNIKDLHKIAVANLMADTPLSYVALYYYVVTIYGYHDAHEIFNALDGQNWNGYYNEYLANGNYRYDTSDLLQSIRDGYLRLQEANPNVDDNQMILDSLENDFINVISRSKIGQPEFSGIAVGLFSLNNASNIGQYH